MRDEGSLRKAGITAMAAVGAAVYLLGSSVKEAGREPAGDMGQPWGAERQSFFPRLSGSGIRQVLDARQAGGDF